MSNLREIKEGLQYIGEDETIVYTLTTTPWGSSPSSEAAKIYEVVGDALTDRTSVLMSGSAAAVNDVITLPAISGCTAGTDYRVEVKFTCAGNVFEAFAELKAER
ncbi:MAG: hypothetical protein ACYSTZ_12825 [Planctomycetota bacterium]|jgi:hypothetical protein